MEVDSEIAHPQPPAATTDLHDSYTPAWPGFEVCAVSTPHNARGLGSARYTCRVRSERQTAIRTAVRRVRSAVSVDDEDTPLSSQRDPPDPHRHPSSANEGSGSEMQENECQGSDDDSGPEEFENVNYEEDTEGVRTVEVVEEVLLCGDPGLFDVQPIALLERRSKLSV